MKSFAMKLKICGVSAKYELNLKIYWARGVGV
jgi:hypothetical protein